MRAALSRLALLQPTSLAEALVWMRERGPLTPLAGGTDVYVALNDGRSLGAGYLDLGRLDELRGITEDEASGSLRIGAMVTYSELRASAAVAARLPILADAAGEVGGIQIQNRGTLGGNVANASPAGDTLPVLAVADAVVVLASADGERRVPLSEFYTGYRATQRRADELITALELPPIEGRLWFRKVGTRAAQAISKIVVAGVRAERPRLAYGSVGPTVLRVPEVEDALAADAGIDEACRLLAETLRPIDDVRSTAAYRSRVAVNLLRQFWAETA